MTIPVVLIAAVARNGAIGIEDRLPWRLSGDLRRFKEQTMGKPVVMGRRTFASIGRPLTGRFPVVLSRDPALVLPDGAIKAVSIDDALRIAREIAAQRGSGEVMVAGGAEIYRATLERADRLRLTEVDLSPEADSTFPSIDPARWRELSRIPGDRRPDDDASFWHVEWARS